MGACENPHQYPLFFTVCWQERYQHSRETIMLNQNSRILMPIYEKDHSNQLEMIVHCNVQSYLCIVLTE
jgi:hypothetical protein